MFAHKLIFLTLFFTLLSCSIYAQTGKIMGLVHDGNEKPIEGVEVSLQGTKFVTKTTAEGTYELTDVPHGKYQINFALEQYDDEVLSIVLADKAMTVRTLEMSQSEGIDLISSEDLIPTVSLSDSDLENDGGGTQNVSGLLTASRDVFFSAAAFSFGFARFRIRGYDSENTDIYLNGIPVNALENGRPAWSAWGGLNDVMRNRDNTVGLNPTGYTFGGVGGSTHIDARASKQWKQLRVSYAFSNRSYCHRLMATYSTGLLKGGWAFSFAGSWRFSPDGGYYDGGYYNAASYFVSAEKKFGENHSIALTALGAPRVRGKNGATTQEMYDLAGTNFYNPYWGYQTSEKTGKLQKRNSRVSDTHQPIVILNHEWNMTDKAKLMTSVGYQFGKNGSSAIDWYNASDPRPDYYRYLPSYYAADDPAQAEAMTEKIMNDVNTRQIDWDGLFTVNRNSMETVADGVTGDSMTGNRSRYIVEERRYDNQNLNFSSVYENYLTDNIAINFGLKYQWYNGRNFKVLEDLLGGDYYYDIDNFAQRDSALNEDFYQNDLDNPNRVLKVGDKFGYNYESQIHKPGAWIQGNFSYSKLDFFVTADLSYTTFWRKGNVRNGKFPNSSAGNSTKQNFINYGVKGGLTYKINGRNYLFANGAYLTRAPFFRNSYISPRTRDQAVDNLVSEKIYTAEAGYLLRAPKAKVRISGYFTRFIDQVSYRSFYLDNAIRTPDGGTTGGFINYVMTGINKQHMGLEIAGELDFGMFSKVLSGLKLTGVAAIGEYKHINRPNVSIYLDNDATELVSDRKVYLQNFYVSGTPQMAFTAGINYRAPQYWFINFNFNYVMRNFMGINPERRTWEAVQYVDDPTYQQDLVEPGSDHWNQIINQEELPGAFTMDFFGGKSFKIRAGERNYFLYINIGVSNMLHNTSIRSGGYEQSRFDYADKNVDKFPNKYYYAYGVNYFMSLTFRM